jgi:peptide/nickel transport system permease protein
MEKSFRKNKIFITVYFVAVLILFFLKSDDIFIGVLLLGRLILEMFQDFKSFELELDLTTLDFLFASGVLLIFGVVSIIGLIHYHLRRFRLWAISRFYDWLGKLSLQILTGLTLVATLFFIAIESPIIAAQHPNYYKDIIVTKLLPPLSEIEYVIVRDQNSPTNKLTSIQELKLKALHPAQDDSKLFMNSYKIIDDKLIYQQGEREYIEPLSHFEQVNGDLKIETKTFYLGTDDFGRDVFSRLIYSSRMSLMIGLLSVLVSFLLGGFIGYSAGFFGGISDVVLMRIVDFFFSVPVLFLIVFLIALFGNSLLLLVFALGLGGWMSIARLTRAETISCNKMEFIENLKIMGQKNLKILTKHILPNTISPIIVALVFQLGNVIMAESALCFLGLGVQPPTPTWGNMIKSGYDFISSAWWLITFGGLAIVCAVLSFNILGEGINKHIDPRRH